MSTRVCWGSWQPGSPPVTYLVCPVCARTVLLQQITPGSGATAGKAVPACHKRC